MFYAYGKLLSVNTTLDLSDSKVAIFEAKLIFNWPLIPFVLFFGAVDIILLGKVRSFHFDLRNNVMV